jgi:hypothetical protein
MPFLVIMDTVAVASFHLRDPPSFDPFLWMRKS